MKKINVQAPVINEIEYSHAGLERLVDGVDADKAELLADYPTVYIVHSEKKAQVTMYVGETTNIKRRTGQHLDADPNTREDWRDFALLDDARMLVIGHEHFNKSMTLDIENRVMLYLSGIQAITKLNNRRTNPQGKYYPVAERNEIFSKIWAKLNRLNKNLFPAEAIIQDSALFKASPFHELNNEQQIAKTQIMQRIEVALQKQQQGQLILVEGEAGAGKTVLLSSLFYELANSPVGETLHAHLLINHGEQQKVYKQIVTKLNIYPNIKEVVSKPTRFLNQHPEGDKLVDIVLVDEGHLLWSQGKQGYKGKSQLADLLKRARVVVVVFDSKQMLSTPGYWEPARIEPLEQQARLAGNLIELKQQMRMHAGSNVMKWLTTFVQGRRILSVPPQQTTADYEVRIFDSAPEMYRLLKKQAQDESHGLSRLLATFDWRYVQAKSPDDAEFWMVKVPGLELPWNLQLPQDKELKRLNRNLAWAEQPQTINEVGSTFTIQGFDLNYAAVILGPSVQYRNGKVVFDKSLSANDKATQQRTLEDGTKQDVSDQLLENEVNVLLSRGVHGLYLYAVDDELRAALMKAQAAGTVQGMLVAERPVSYDTTED